MEAEGAHARFFAGWVLQGGNTATQNHEALELFTLALGVSYFSAFRDALYKAIVSSTGAEAGIRDPANGV